MQLLDVHTSEMMSELDGSEDVNQEKKESGAFLFLDSFSGTVELRKFLPGFHLMGVTTCRGCSVPKWNSLTMVSFSK